MVILGIISAALVVFLQRPVEGYVDTARRARMVDTADFALRRIARDLATALPNSIRSDGTRQYLEMLQTRSGGRFCGACDCTDPLIPDSTCATDTAGKFSILGPGLTAGVDFVNGDSVVIGSLPLTNPGCNAYDGTNNRRSLNFGATAPTTVAFSGGAYQITCAEATKRFQIVSGPVTYACDPGTKTLWRYSGYAIQAAQPIGIATLDGIAPVKSRLATNVNCAGTFLDASSASTVGAGLVELSVQLKDASTESVSLYRQVLVDNTP